MDESGQLVLIEQLAFSQSCDHSQQNILYQITRSFTIAGAHQAHYEKSLTELTHKLRLGRRITQADSFGQTPHFAKAFHDHRTPTFAADYTPLLPACLRLEDSRAFLQNDCHVSRCATTTCQHGTWDVKAQAMCK